MKWSMLIGALIIGVVLFSRKTNASTPISRADDAASQDSKPAKPIDLAPPPPTPAAVDAWKNEIASQLRFENDVRMATNFPPLPSSANPNYELTGGYGSGSGSL